MTPREHSFHPSCRDDRKLIEVFPSHCLKGLDHRRVGRNRSEFMQQMSHLDHRRVVPEHAFHLGQVGRSDHPDDLATIFDGVTAPSGLQHVLIRKPLHGQIGGHRQALVGHEIPDADIRQTCQNFRLHVARGRGVQQEPSQQAEPNAAETCR